MPFRLIMDLEIQITKAEESLWLELRLSAAHEMNEGEPDGSPILISEPKDGKAIFSTDWLDVILYFLGDHIAHCNFILNSESSSPQEMLSAQQKVKCARHIDKKLAAAKMLRKK